MSAATRALALVAVAALVHPAGDRAAAAIFDPTTGEPAPNVVDQLTTETSVVVADPLDTLHRERFAAGIGALVSRGGTQASDVLAKIRTTLATPRMGATLDEAIALSEVLAAERSLTARTRPTAEVARAEDLTAAERWRLFVEVDAWSSELRASHGWDRRGLVHDLGRHPGYYAAMSAAFERYVIEPSRKAAGGSAVGDVTYELYLEMHDAVIDGVWDRARALRLARGWAHSGRQAPFADLHVDRVEPDALVELFKDGQLAVRDVARKVIPPKVFEELQLERVVTSFRGKGGPPVALMFQGTADQPTLVTVALWDPSPEAYVRESLRTYYETLVPAATTEDLKLEAIAWLVRRLDAGQVFEEGNRPLHAMLLLNRLLVQQKLSPAIVEAPGRFAGLATRASLVAEIRAGQRRFQAAANPDRAAAVAMGWAPAQCANTATPRAFQERLASLLDPGGTNLPSYMAAAVVQELATCRAQATERVGRILDRCTANISAYANAMQHPRTGLAQDATAYLGEHRAKLALPALLTDAKLFALIQGVNLATPSTYQAVVDYVDRLPRDAERYPDAPIVVPYVTPRTPSIDQPATRGRIVIGLHDALTRMTHFTQFSVNAGTDGSARQQLSVVNIDTATRQAYIFDWKRTGDADVYAFDPEFGNDQRCFGCHVNGYLHVHPATRLDRDTPSWLTELNTRNVDAVNRLNRLTSGSGSVAGAPRVADLPGFPDFMDDATGPSSRCTTAEVAAVGMLFSRDGQTPGTGSCRGCHQGRGGFLDLAAFRTFTTDHVDGGHMPPPSSGYHPAAREVRAKAADCFVAHASARYHAWLRAIPCEDPLATF